MGARDRVRGLIDASWTTQAIAAGCELGLFDALARDRRGASSLALELGADADALARLAKALCTLGLLQHGADGSYALAPEGECLRTDSPQSLHGWARMAGSRLWSNWAQLGGCVRTGRSVAELRGGRPFADMDEDARAAEVFNGAMVDLTRHVAEAAATILDWSGVRGLVDVGGGSGALAIGVLARHPAMHGVVCDLEHARSSALAAIEAAGLAGRCRFETRDFFTSLPLDGDVCLLKSVLHNWPDAAAAKILRACANSRAGARVIVIDRLTPAVTATDEVSREVARSDLNMLVGCGGRERSELEFRALLLSAGFELTRVTALVSGFHALEGYAASDATLTEGMKRLNEARARLA
jgi:hypothetical protein